MWLEDTILDQQWQKQTSHLICKLGFECSREEVECFEERNVGSVYMNEVLETLSMGVVVHSIYRL